MFTKALTRIGAAAAAVVVVTACGHAGADPRPPATVTRIPGSPVAQVRLTDLAVHRLGIATAAVHEARVAVDGTAGTHKVVPYSAVIYDTRGASWVYVNTAPRTYVRQAITIAGIEGNTAVLARGPAAGAPVVTVGAPELLGTEYNISGEQ
jgi:hypothetical protein